MESTLTHGSDLTADRMLLPFVTFQPISLEQANECLSAWGHKMGPCVRGKARGSSHGLLFEGELVAVTITATLIRDAVGNAPGLNRGNTVELARLCAARAGLCRVAIRLWREFVFPQLGYRYAISYQDAELHNGNTYRFDGWQRISRSRSGVDSRSGRKGRDKWVWLWPPNSTLG
jgi:antitoxin VapB